MVMPANSQKVAEMLRSMTPTARESIWNEAECAPADALAAFTDGQLLDALFDRGVDRAEAVERLKLTADHYPLSVLALAIKKDAYLENFCSSLELLEYIEEEDLIIASEELQNKIGWPQVMERCLRATDFEANPLERERILAALGVADALIKALEQIEVGEAHAAHATLDQLINPKWRSRAAKLGSGPDEAEWADLVAFALPYVETAEGAPLYRDSAQPRIKQLIERMRKAIEATEVGK